MSKALNSALKSMVKSTPKLTMKSRVQSIVRSVAKPSSILHYFFAFILVFSVSTLLGALFIDRFLGFDPCILCLYQRVPYGAMAALGVFGLCLPSCRKCIFYIMILPIISGLVLSVYHTGIEQHWWEPISQCSFHSEGGAALSQTKTLEDFMNSIASAEMPDCSKPKFLFLGFSLAQINIVMNLMLLVVFSYVFRVVLKGRVK